jgi:hypothetical protein
MRKSRFFIAISGALLALLTSTLVSPAQAQLVEMPEDWDVFPKCIDTEENVMCLQKFDVDSDQNGNFEDALNDDSLYTNVYLFDNKDNNVASLAAYVYSNEGYQNLDPALPVGSKINLEINTRDWKPNPQAFTTAKLDAFRVEQVEGEWITYATIETKSYSIKREAEQGGGIMTQDSQANLIMWGDEFKDAYSYVFDGMYISSNAATTTWPYYDSTSMTWTLDSSGPALDTYGESNIAYLNAFFPDTAIISAYGADPVSMVGVFKVMRKDGTETVEQEVVISRVESPTPGILIEIPAYGFSSNEVIETLSSVRKQIVPLAGSKYKHPKHIVKPKTKLLSAPSLYSLKKQGNKVVLSGSKVSAANSYQGVCIKGSKIRYGTSNNPKVTINNLGKGNWNCRIRGVKKIGGKWSNAIKVKVS